MQEICSSNPSVVIGTWLEVEVSQNKILINIEKVKSCKLKEQKIKSFKIRLSYIILNFLNYIKLVEEIKNNIGQPNFETLVLALYCYCGDNVKYALLSKTSFQRKQQHGGWGLQ